MNEYQSQQWRTIWPLMNPKINLPSYSLRTHEQLISKGFVASIMVS